VEDMCYEIRRAEVVCWTSLLLFLLLQYLLQSCLWCITVVQLTQLYCSTCVCVCLVCVFITAGPSTKLFAFSMCVCLLHK
jgi:hypothetical protein